MANWPKSSTTSERLQLAMKNANMKQADLARATGLSKGGISNYVLGRYEPKSNIISKLAKALHVNEMWLWGYDVPMERQQTPSPDKHELTEGEKIWLSLYNRLSDDTRGVFVKMMDSFDQIPADKQRFLVDAIRIALENQK